MLDFFKNTALKILLLLFLISLTNGNSAELRFKSFPAKPNPFASRRSTEVNILAIMVDFMEDTLASTTGNGKFNSEYLYPDSLLLDIGDHDSSYFKDHLLFYKNYFEKVSDNQITFDKMDVYGKVISLKHPIWYYNRNDDNDDSLNVRLIKLYQESFKQIKDQQEINFSDYNTFIIFHAGSGQEFSLEYDETPFDIPSVYFNSNDLEGNIIKTHDGSLISNVTILPECEWQKSEVKKDEPKWHYSSLNGIGVIMLYHHFGLPNLYSTANNKTTSGVGRFDPLDQGSGNFKGILPCSPSAWTKYYKGWQGAQDLYFPQDSIRLEAGKDLCKIDINENEYFLIENRISHTKNYQDSIRYGYDKDNNKVLKIYYHKKVLEEIEVLEPGKVPVRFDDYDFAVPASGILVWHVDKSKTTPEMVAANKVNQDYKNRGVYLEEADGSFDIGQEYWLLDPGYGTELGWAYDAFFDSNRVWYAQSNEFLGKVEFSKESYPRSDANNGLKTGIVLNNFSNPAQFTRFDFSYDNLASGYPLNLEIEPFKAKSYYSAKTNNYYQIIASLNGEVKVYNDTLLVQEYQLGTNLSNYDISVFNDAIYLILEDLKTVAVINLESGNLATTSFTSEIDHEPVANIIHSENSFTIVNEYGELSNTISLELAVKHYAAAYDGSGYITNIAYLTDQEFGLIDGESLEISFQKKGSFAKSKRIYLFESLDQGFKIVVAGEKTLLCDLKTAKEYLVEIATNELIHVLDFDNDGKIEFVSLDGNLLKIRNRNGVLENFFPLELAKSLEGISRFVNFKVNGKNNFVLIDSLGNTSFYNHKGQRNRVFDFSIPAQENSFKSLFEKNDQLCLSLITDFGVAYNYPLFAGNIDLYESATSENFNAQNNYYQRLSKEAATTNKLVKNGNVYNYPNPVKDGKTAFRCYLEEAAKIEVEIYDLSGNKIKSLAKDFYNSKEYVELNWLLEDVASGVYFGRVKVKSLNSNKEEKYTVKIAVTR